MEEDIPDITCFKFGDDRLRGLASAEGQILPLPIDFDGRPYNTLTLPCDDLRANCEVHKFVYDTTLTELIPSLHALSKENVVIDNVEGLF